MSVIRLDKVSVSLRNKSILQDVSIDICKAQCVGILGPNGSGKSTAIKVAAGLLAPLKGRVDLLGRDISSWARSDLSRRLTYLPQGGDVHWPLKVQSVVELGRLPHATRGALSSDDSNAIKDAMTKCDVLHLSERPVSELSGGEKARVLLARVLATKAGIILADEPFAQLDPHHQIHAMEVLKSEAAAGATVVVVLHDLAMAARHCDRVVLISNGRVAADGLPSDVLSSDRLREVFGVDAYIGEHQGSPIILPIKRRA